MFANLRYGARVSQVICTAAPIIFSLMRDFRRFLFWGSPRELTQTGHQRRASKIRNKLERMGIVFIKVGQVISSRGDLLPPAYLNELSKLQDSVNPLPETIVRATLEREYGSRFGKIFDQFTFKPLATASIGQVHRAIHNGRQIVVKFARPNIKEQLSRDSRTAAIVLSMAERAFLLLGISDMNVVMKLYRQAVTEVFRGMMEETDLGRERRNAEMLASAVADIKDVVLPKTIPEICTERVLALEYLSGTKISHIDELKKQGHDFKELMNRLVTLYVRMIAIKGVYHADPHPGNIYVLRDGRFLLFDFGIVRTLSDKTRQTLMRLALAAVKKDTISVIDELYNIGILNRSADRATALQVAEKVASLHFQGLTSRRRVEEVAETIRSAFQGFPLDLPQELVYVFRCLSLLEGLGTRYQPGWNLIADGSPGIRAALAEYLMKSRNGWWTIFKSFVQNIFDLFRKEF
jgi:predicted unusual protein kinase regulating ubiquinone biosynthesis (AarF/ABC1/UbiB family)